MSFIVSSIAERVSGENQWNKSSMVRRMVYDHKLYRICDLQMRFLPNVLEE